MCQAPCLSDIGNNIETYNNVYVRMFPQPQTLHFIKKKKKRDTEAQKD